MTENQKNWGTERGRHFYDVSDKASHMVAERITLENLGLSLLELPLCTETEAMAIEELIPRAKEGFALGLKVNQVSSNQIRDLHQQTAPKSISGIWSSVKITEHQNTLPEYSHVIASLALLHNLGQVSYFDFSTPPTSIDLNLGRIVTFWNQDLDVEHLWQTLEDLEISIRATLYQKDSVGIRDLVKVGHFFEAGKEISEIFK